MASKDYTQKQKLIVLFPNALAHPLRVAILELLVHQSCCSPKSDCC